MNDTVRVDAIDAQIAQVTLNRPDVLNALNTPMGEALVEAFRSLANDAVRGGIRAVILTGAGDRAFCAGADLKERQGMSDEAWRRQHEVFETAVAEIAACPSPVIAAVNGVALGGGNEIALACDLVIASETARFGQPEVARGLMPGLGGTQRLPRRVGISRAKELLYTGRLIDAGEALAWGLVNHVAAPGDLMPRAIAIARAIAANGPSAVRHVKAAIDAGLALALEEALACERSHYSHVIETGERLEGIAAFNEKRPPRFGDT